MKPRTYTIGFTVLVYLFIVLYEGFELLSNLLGLHGRLMRDFRKYRCLSSHSFFMYFNIISVHLKITIFILEMFTINKILIFN